MYKIEDLQKRITKFYKDGGIITEDDYKEYIDVLKSLEKNSAALRFF